MRDTQRRKQQTGLRESNISANNNLHKGFVFQDYRLLLNLSSPPSLTPSLCRPLFLGWNKRVDYEPGTGSKQLFPKMHLETCGGPLSSVRTTVELQTSHIGKGCDRETYSEKSLQKLCGWLTIFFFFLLRFKYHNCACVTRMTRSLN